ncbi:MAG: hypothetical protein IKE76_09470 [Clostridia bacterium]|nr:hypothetical protein [Clostridia bacterium]
MKTYLDLLLLAAVVVYVVDLSGWSDTVTDFASRILGRRVQAVKPLTCSLCMTFWAGLLWALFTHALTLPVVAWICALSYLSQPLGQLAATVREWVVVLLDKIFPKL